MQWTGGTHTGKWTGYDSGGMATEGEWLLRTHTTAATPPTLAQLMDSYGEPFRCCSKHTNSDSGPKKTLKEGSVGVDATRASGTTSQFPTMPHFDAKGITLPEKNEMSFRSLHADGRARGVVPKTRSLGRVRIVVLSVVAIFLAWLVIRQSFAAYFAYVAPETALWLQPQQSLALVNLADQTLKLQANLHPSNPAVSEQTPERPENASAEPNESTKKVESASSELETTDQTGSANPKLAPDSSGTTGDLAQPLVLPEATATAVRAWAKAALMGAPLNPRAVRILGQLEASDQHYDAASKLMNAAAQLSLHEIIAVYSSMLTAAKAKDYKTTAYYADVLLRTLPRSDKFVVPILTRIVEDKESSGLVEAALAANPPWRGQFFAILPDSVEDARTPLNLLLALRTSAAPPTTAEIAPYVDFLIRQGLYDLAYYTWLQLLPVDELRGAGLLFNGRFDVDPSGLPFDWNFRSGSGVTMEIVPIPDGNGTHALQVDFAYGRVDYRSVRQLVMLAPGSYTFKGRYKGQLIGPRGLKWRILCAGGPTVGESEMIIGMMPSWRDVAFNFTVPATGCRAQYVRLDLDARMASEQLISGSMLFGDLQILRVANPS
jgi:hypothetical protein